MAKERIGGFAPTFGISPATAANLMRIEAVRQTIGTLPINPRVLASLRETARLFSTHYSTMIEGNRLTQEQVGRVISAEQHFAGRERDEAEVKGYYAALDEVERLTERQGAVSEATIQKLHALVMAGGKTRVRPTPYRDGQNVIRDSRSSGIVYMPPEAKDVPTLMKEFVGWINIKDDLPVPIRAGIAHYQFATIHPYYDGNGRTARLLTTLILHLGGYGLKGLYALEEYYARGLKDYYEALTIGPSHNYYMGRASADITRWVSYFIDGMAVSFQKVKEQAQAESTRGAIDQSRLLRTLDARQRKVLALFRDSREISAKEIGTLFGFQPRTAALLCQRWVESNFLIPTSMARKTRRYRLADQYEAMIEGRLN
ncbi:Fic family protein [Bryocella elongata]|uniref:Fic family protein n=1 Tax=Bryocella elongata TaxID=863522 RepID=A0A1H5VR70_9BACT|nr:Fic family protein [Bryocella elongata]SEF89835.1 Fic family protein [Bryocella elongata]